MKYIILNVISFIAFILTLVLVKLGYFNIINNYFYSLPRNGILVDSFFVLTDLGGVVFVFTGSLIGILFLFFQNNYKAVVNTVFSIVGGFVSQFVIKDIALIHRPPNHFVSSVGESFPSGHTNMVTILFLSLYIYIFQHVSDVGHRKILLLITLSVIILVGVSRVYLNAHWFSDVLAAWFLAIFWVTLLPSLSYTKKHFTQR